MTQAFNALLMPLLFGSVYWQINTSQEAAYDRISAVALTVLMLAFFHYDIVMLFPVERAIFNRENTAGMYRPISFFVGRTTAETPQHLFLVFIMGTIAYWMFGLQNDAEKYLTFILIVESMVVSSAGLLYMVSAFSPNEETSNLLVTMVLLLMMLFDGNWVSLDKVPAMWRWMEHISCMGYSSQAAIASEYRGLSFSCSASAFAEGLCLKEDGTDITGEEILYNRGINDVDITFNIIMLWVLAVVYRFIGWLGFWLLYRPMSPKQIIKDTFGCR